MKINKVSIALAVAFLLSSCMQQESPSSSNAAATETSSIAEQSLSSEVSEISEEPRDSSETSDPSEIDISEFAVKFAKETGDNHPIVKRVVGGQEKYCVAYEEMDTLVRMAFAYTWNTNSYQEISGIQIETSTGFVYLNRNGKVEIESQGTVREYLLKSFLQGYFEEFATDYYFSSTQNLNFLSGDIWFCQDDDNITFISLYIDAETEMGKTNISRFNLQTGQFGICTKADYFFANCLLDSENLYVLCDLGHVWEQFYVYVFSWEDLVLVKQSEKLIAENETGPRDMRLYIEGGMLCGSYLSDGSESVMEIIPTAG